MTVQEVNKNGSEFYREFTFNVSETHGFTSIKLLGKNYI